jgi:mRNA interferase RelE/StbE
VVWSVEYHPLVVRDFQSVSTAGARTIMKAIDARMYRGEAHKSGKPLSGDLAGCRRIRVSDMRIIYQVDTGAHRVVVLAVGMRRRDEVYKLAATRR